MDAGTVIMKKCRKCGEEKPETEFYRNRNYKSGRESMCAACALEYKKAEYRRNRMNPDGITVAADGKKYTKKDAKRCIYWDGNMISLLKKHFPTTLNEEMAEMLGVSQRTMIRKARELGLEKDPEWLTRIWNERRIMAQASNRAKGYPGSFQKGRRYNPDGEFKPGYKEDEETKARRIEKYRRWCLHHPRELKERGAKVWATRRSNMQTKGISS